MFELLLFSDGKYISDFNGGKATVTIPYELKDGQTVQTIVVYFMDNNGKLYERETSYDIKNKCITFITPHFSKYVICDKSDNITVNLNNSSSPSTPLNQSTNNNSFTSGKYNPSTGSSDFVSAMTLVATLSLGGFIVLSKKKK